MGSGFYHSIYCEQGHLINGTIDLSGSKGYCPICGTENFLIKRASGDAIDGREPYYSSSSPLFYNSQENPYYSTTYTPPILQCVKGHRVEQKMEIMEMDNGLCACIQCGSFNFAIIQLKSLLVIGGPADPFYSNKENPFYPS